MAEEKTPPLLSMLQRLPPSKELLDFYHKKLEQYVEEESRWLKRLANTKKAVDHSRKLEKEVFAQKREITALQKAVTDMREALAQERKINNKLYAENDRIRIKELEDRRKVVALLELSGKSDHEVTKLLDAADKRGHLGLDPFVPQRVQDYMDKAKVTLQLFLCQNNWLNYSHLLTIDTIYCFANFRWPQKIVFISFSCSHA